MGFWKWLKEDGNRFVSNSLCFVRMKLINEMGSRILGCMEY